MPKPAAVQRSTVPVTAKGRPLRRPALPAPAPPLRAVMNNTSPEFLEDRRQRRGDRWDEMWGGVLHMNPGPSRLHQDFQDELQFWLRELWARPFGNRVFREVNLCKPGDWPKNYRIPGLLLLDPPRSKIDQDVYFEGPPLVVVEIHSPGDEAFEKLAFYTELAVPEVWIFDRDSRGPQLFALWRKKYRPMAADEQGWLVSRATGVRFRPRRPKRLAVQRGDDAATLRLIPETAPS